MLRPCLRACGGEVNVAWVMVHMSIHLLNFSVLTVQMKDEGTWNTYTHMQKHTRSALGTFLKEEYEPANDSSLCMELAIAWGFNFLFALKNTITLQCLCISDYRLHRVIPSTRLEALITTSLLESVFLWIASIIDINAQVLASARVS